MEIAQEKKITANDTIVSMLIHIGNDKKELFYQSVENYVSTLPMSNNFQQRIKRLVSERPRQLIELNNLSNDIKRLINQSVIADENVFLNDTTKSLIDELLLEWGNKDIYKHHNLPIRNKILLHGITGNGKTTIARHIAKLTNLPFVEVNSDSMIDSKIGNSGFNIYQIFNQIKQPCVLFWDEVDTIGRKRGKGGDSAAGLENERMVNSILVNMEKLSNDVVFIGATNRYDVLDSAFLRRFDIKFEIAPPTIEEKEDFALQMMEYYKIPPAFLPYLDEYNNYSDIKLMFMDKARKYILNSIKEVPEN